MDLLMEVQRLFHLDDALRASERVKVFETSFDIKLNGIPSFCAIGKFISIIPKRDNIIISLTNDVGEQIIISNKDKSLEENYQYFCGALDDDSDINVKIYIEKSIFENTFSVYSYDCFVDDLLSLNIVQVMSSFNLLMKDLEFLVFELFDEKNSFFTTETMAFVSGERKTFNSKILRKERLQSCKETTYFYDISSYELLPEDFLIKIDYENNRLSDMFKKIHTMLSLIYISSSSSLKDNWLKIQISGQRNVDFSYNVDNMKINTELYKIYDWIYTDGNSIDKAIIARNIISLHCRYSNLIDIDEKTFSSIQSNYNLYLKNNVNKYIELKNKIADFICTVVIKSGDNVTTLFGNYKTNLITLAGFIFSAVFAKIMTQQSLENISNSEIMLITEIALMISIIYLITCVIEVKYKVNQTQETYNYLRSNYESIFSEAELEEIFKKDEMITSVLKSAKNKIYWISILWVASIVMAIWSIECFCEGTTVLKFFYNKINSIINLYCQFYAN